jgi:hypothetical protein
MRPLVEGDQVNGVVPPPRVSDEHPSGEDPKGLRAEPASAVGKAETP